MAPQFVYVLNRWLSSLCTFHLIYHTHRPAATVSTPKHTLITYIKPEIEVKPSKWGPRTLPSGRHHHHITSLTSVSQDLEVNIFSRPFFALTLSVEPRRFVGPQGRTGQAVTTHQWLVLNPHKRKKQRNKVLKSSSGSHLRLRLCRKSVAVDSFLRQFLPLFFIIGPSGVNGSFKDSRVCCYRPIYWLITTREERKGVK